jgi:hypothetical protein
MSPEDYKLDPYDERAAVDLADDSASLERRRRPLLPALLIVLAALAIGWGIWHFTRDRGVEAPPPVAAVAPSEEPQVEPVTQEAVDLPALAQSDAWLREVVKQLSGNPQLATWLVNDDLVRRVVAAAVNVSGGESPRTHVRFLQPGVAFSAVEREGRLVVDAASYERYDTLVAVITSLHVEGTAQVYRNIKPLLDEAYRELGYPDGDFDTVAARAVKTLLDTPIVADPALEGFASSYRYTDPRLENLSAAQKQFLRLGPDNLRAVQNHVRRIALRAGLSLD